MFSSTAEIRSQFGVLSPMWAIKKIFVSDVSHYAERTVCDVRRHLKLFSEYCEHRHFQTVTSAKRQHQLALEIIKEFHDFLSGVGMYQYTYTAHKSTLDTETVEMLQLLKKSLDDKFSLRQISRLTSAFAKIDDLEIICHLLDSGTLDSFMQSAENLGASRKTPRKM